LFEKGSETIILPMARVLHIIDRDTPGDLLDQLSLLAGAGERIVSSGPPPAWAEFRLPVTVAHRPFASAWLSARWMQDAVRGASVIHAWSASAAPAGEALTERIGGRLIVSLATASQAYEVGDLLDALRLGVVPGVVTVPTEAAKQALCGEGEPGDWLAVLPPAGAPIDDRRARRQRTREALGATDADRIMIALGEMTRHAGHKYASWAHAMCRQVVPHLLLLLPGGGPVEDRVEFFSETTGRDEEVFLTGDRFERADLLAAADLGVQFCERDCGTAALAGAMAAGLPLAAARTPDVTEIAPHEVGAVLAESCAPRHATASLLRILDDPDFAARLGKSAAQRASEHFNPERCRRRLDDIYAPRPAGVS
jgi:glycosyltransferase involved in cell wall biosynthesis